MKKNIDELKIMYLEICNYNSSLQNFSLHSSNNDSIIWSTDIAIAEEMIKNKKMKLFIEKCHTTSDGKLRTIKEVHDRKGATIYKTRVAKGKDITAISLDKLYEKLFDYYTKECGFTYDEESYICKNLWKAAFEYYQKRHINKNKTIEDYEDRYNRYVTPEMSNTDLRKLSKKDLEDYFLDYIKSHQINKKGFYGMKGVFNLIYDFAIDNSDKYPDIKKHIPKKMDNNLFYELVGQNDKGSKTESDYIHTEEEINKIFDEAFRRSKMPQFQGYYIYFYMLLTHYELGCRPGELVALRWSDIKDTSDGEKIFSIKYSQRDNRDGTFSLLNFTKDEKGNSKGGRENPISDYLLTVLARLKKLQEELGINSEFIFCNRNGEWIKAKDYIQTLNKICKKLGIKSKGSYCFRHEVNALYEKNGMTDASKGKTMGNKERTNRDYYVHPEADYVKQARINLNKRNFSYSF